MDAEVTIANNGLEAFELLEKNEYDCILMDIQMPVMDGYQTTRNIRADPRFKHYPVIALTANAGNEDKKKCLEIGMDDIVTKPFKPVQLFKVINRLLKVPAED